MIKSILSFKIYVIFCGIFSFKIFQLYFLIAFSKKFITSQILTFFICTISQFIIILFSPIMFKAMVFIKYPWVVYILNPMTQGFSPYFLIQGY